MERVGQRTPQRAAGVALLRTGQPDDHLAAAEHPLGVIEQDVRRHGPTGQRQQGQHAAIEVERVTGRVGQPQADVAADRIAVDQQRPAGPERRRQHGGGGRARRTLGREERDDAHRLARHEVDRRGGCRWASSPTAT